MDGRFAVVPTKELLKAEHPVQSSYEIVKASRYAFALGIFVVLKNEDDDGHLCDEDDQSDEDHEEDEARRSDGEDTGTQPLTMYYVSPFVARQRPSEVKSGWYCCAEPGRPFEVVIMPTHAEESVRITAGDSTDVILARLQVDGKDTDDVDMVFDENECDEKRVFGFTESAELSGMDRRSTLRRFQFYKSRTTHEEGVAGKIVPNAGQIRMYLESGKYSRQEVHTPRRKTPKKKQTPTKTAKDSNAERVVHEETAVKWGLSVGVSRDGEEGEADNVVCPVRIRKRRKLPKPITIFVRERFWLESRRIIDLNGNAYRPPNRPPAPVVDLEIDDGDDDEEPGEQDEVEKEVKKEVKQESQIFAPGEIIELDLD